MPKVVFLTGATGFVGGELLRRLLEREDLERIYALCRAKDALDLRRRGREVLFKLFPSETGRPPSRYVERVKWVRGDMMDAGLQLDAAEREAIIAEAEVVYHSAAATDFDLPEEKARRINLEGAKNVLALSEAIHAAGHLKRHVHISTAYVAGERAGRILEPELPGPEGPFGNTYELTKAAAERMLRQRMQTLPITVVRPSIVVGSSETGRTYNFNVLYYPIKLLHRGVLPYVPGLSSTTLDIVPVDYVCDATLALSELDEAEGGTYHLTAAEDAILLTRFVERLSGYYNSEREKLGVGPLPPCSVVGPLRWKLLSWWTRRRLGGRALEQFEAFNLYLPYLLTEKVFDSTEARRLLGDRVPYPKIDSYLERVAEYAVTRDWGRRVSWDPSLLESGIWRDSASGVGFPHVESGQS